MIEGGEMNIDCMKTENYEKIIELKDHLLKRVKPKENKIENEVEKAKKEKKEEKEQPES